MKGRECGCAPGQRAGACRCLSRRDLLRVSVGIGLVAGTAQAGPGSERGGSVCLDLSAIPPGESTTVLWRGERIFVRHRTKQEIRAARAVPLEELIDPEPDEARVRDRKWIVVVGVCTHAGCKPIEGLGDHGGWLCLCHGSDFDMSGRVRKGPATENLRIPPYVFVAPQHLLLGTGR